MVLIYKQDDDEGLDMDKIREKVAELDSNDEKIVKPLKDSIRGELSKDEGEKEAREGALTAKLMGENLPTPHQNEESELENIKLSTWLNTQYGNELDIVKDISSLYKINLTEAQKHICKYPEEPIIAEKNLPDLIKELKDIRRKFKGEDKLKITKGIDHLISAYEYHINDCVKSIYWVAPYKPAMDIMGISEKNLRKMYHIKDGDRRKRVIDSLCKMWEAKLDRDSLSYGKEYSTLTKEISNCKKKVREILKGISHQTIRKSKKEMIYAYIKEVVCESPGLTSNAIHSRLPESYTRLTTPQSISKMLRKMSATKIDDEYYLVSEEIKKDLYSYVAGFIDSDGYITMDASTAPRIGMIATGNRGRAFFETLEKELKCGRLHLDQKVGENSRSQHRLNFYSQEDISTLLGKCLPHLRMKQKQGELLLEAIRIKKNHKKEEWSKSRLQEIFKLMKYENWKDSRGQGGREFEKYGIDPEVVVKYHDNCKMELMDSIESGVE